MNVLKKALILLLAVTMIVGIMPLRSAHAVTKPDKPVITLEAEGDGTDVKITIKETTGAQGYKIVMKAPGEKKFKKINTLKKDGTAVRTYTVKSLTDGKYAFKVKAFTKSGSKTVYGSYSKVKSITVKKQAAGESVSDFSKAKTGDYIIFGSYEQDDYVFNGNEPIEWLVLSNNGKELFVVSKYGLDCQPYNTESVDITWEKCSLRKWLNDDFYNAAFSSSEKKLIKTTKLKNNDNPAYMADGGKDTNDKVFLLSLNDVTNTGYGFSSEENSFDIARNCAPTEYAVWQGAYVASAYEEGKTADGEWACGWWLRTLGHSADSASEVGFFGYVNYINADYDHTAVRPALVINLE